MSFNIMNHGEYGINWNALASEYDQRLAEDPFIRELFLYRFPNFRDEYSTGTQWEHMRKAIKLHYSDKQFAWHRWIDFMGENWCEEDSLVIWGASSTAKSSTMAMIHLMDFQAAPYETYLLVITNKMKQHGKRFWGAFVKWRAMLPDEYLVGQERKEPLGLFTQMDTPPQAAITVMKGDIRGVECKSMMIGDAETNVKDVIGAHAERNRLFVDEAQACSHAIEAIPKNLGASGEFKCTFVGNPDSKTNPLGTASEPLDGNWDKTSLRETKSWLNKREWKGEPSKTIVLDGRDCPSAEDPKRLFFLLDPVQVKSIAKRLANKEPVKRSDYTYTIGRIPPAGTAATIISEAEITVYKAKRKPVWVDIPVLHASIDPSKALADRDACPILFFETGVEMGTGEKICNVKEIVLVEIDASDKSVPEQQQLANLILYELDVRKVPLSRVSGDDGGGYGAILDVIEMVRKDPTRPIYRCQPSGKATSRNLYNDVEDKKKPSDRFKDRATELLENTCAAVRAGKVAGMTTAIEEQLTTREYEDSTGLLKCERKKAWKDRHAQKSPNELDALAVGIDYLLEKGLITLKSYDMKEIQAAQAAKRQMNPKNKGIFQKRAGLNTVRNIIRNY